MKNIDKRKSDSTNLNESGVPCTMGLKSELNSNLAIHTRNILESALADLKSDPNVLSIYLTGSLASGIFDQYSDIDLHIVVRENVFHSFIQNKRSRSSNWGDVMFFEGGNSVSPVVVTHYNSFVKVDSWYHTLNQLKPSLWLKNTKVLYDPEHLLNDVIEESIKKKYSITGEEVQFWRGKILAFYIECYRAFMRNEQYYAASNVDKIKWLMVYGWYMEKKIHLDRSFYDWSTIEGSRCSLEEWQLHQLRSWNCGYNQKGLLKTLKMIEPMIVVLNRSLSSKASIDSEETVISNVMNKLFELD